METSNQPVSPLRQRMLEDMRMRKLAPKTREAYIRAVSRFAKYLGRSPDTATAEDLRGYQLHLVDSGTSPITLNATITGLKFLFDVTLGHGDVLAKMHGLSARAAIRGKRATKNIRKVAFPEVFFGLLPVVFPYIKALGVRNFLLFCSIEQREVLHEEGTIH